MDSVQYTFYITDGVRLTADVDLVGFAGWKGGNFSDSEE